jgi:alpha-tubulin suppressor-like RCC1 family protein
VPPYAAFPVVGLSDAVEIAAGGSCTYARRADGSVVAWGVNARGGLGNTPLAEFEANARARPNASAPVPVLGLTDAVGIAANGDHALAVTKGGAVYAWGYNINHQLGIGEWPVINYKTRSAQPTNYLPYPVPVPGMTDVAAVAAGIEHSLALMKDGTVRGWGLNRWGQVGDGTVVNRNTPVAVTGVRNAVAVAARDRISAALLADGTVMTWGFGHGGLGRKAYKPDGPHPTPALVPGVTGIRAIALGEHHVLAITTAGTLISWGDSLVGEVGHEGSLPAPVAGLSNVRAVAADTLRSFAILANGTLMTWGGVPLWASVNGQSGSSIGTPIPLVISGLRDSWPSGTYTVGQ